MKLLVLSDSHGYESKMADIIMQHMDVNAIVFLGDGERDFENALAECNIYPFGDNTSISVSQVRGNCDRCSTEPVTIARKFGGVCFLITHGFDQNVKLGYWGLVDEAKHKMCTAALFGHTHRKHFSEKDGVTLINPGSAANGSYALLEVENGQIRQVV